MVSHSSRRAEIARMLINRKVQERALKVVPDLCETIDYAEVQGVLFPRVAVCSFFPS